MLTLYQRLLSEITTLFHYVKAWKLEGTAKMAVKRHTVTFWWIVPQSVHQRVMTFSFNSVHLNFRFLETIEPLYDQLSAAHSGKQGGQKLEFEYSMYQVWLCPLWNSRDGSSSLSSDWHTSIRESPVSCNKSVLL